MFLTSLKIENYRSFKRYEVQGLSRVNLFVGPNNCGKTSVLEAAYLYCQRGSDRSIAKILEARGDFVYHEQRFGIAKRIVCVRLPELFHERQTASATTKPICIESDAGRLVVMVGRKSDVLDQRRLEAGDAEFTDIEPWGNDDVILHSQFADSHKLRARLTNEGYLPIDRPDGHEGFEEANSRLLTTGGMASQDLKSIWSTLLIEHQESVAATAMRVIIPKLTEIIFLPNTVSPPEGRADILLQVNGRRESISAFGEGANRLLALGVSLGACKGGHLLVDEIDTGLHYSALADMWRMVLVTARELDVQVFATTHSYDCLNALHEVVSRDASLRDLVAVHRIERAIERAVDLTGSEFVSVLNSNSEVR